LIGSSYLQAFEFHLIGAFLKEDRSRKIAFSESQHTQEFNRPCALKQEIYP
jgi:hypothetical protein